MNIVITGGGTGGHVFPGLALAAALGRRLREARIFFMGDRSRIEGRLVPAAGFPLIGLKARGLAGMRPARRLANALVLPVGLGQALWHMLRLRPRLVVGMGGYVSGPVVAAAWLTGRRVAIHEQNLSPGLTNRWLARLADLVMVSYRETERHFAGRRVALTGNPVRREAMAGERPAPGPGGARLLVLGGSQGSRSLNTMMTAAAVSLPREGLRITHQTGEADLGRMREAYLGQGREARVFAFSADVGRLYAEADLVVCRAGATTLAELAANGLPSVLVPFPGAAGGHQEENARHFAAAGAAVVVPDRGPEGAGELAAAVAALLADDGRRRRMAAAAAGLARQGAEEAMAEACLELMGPVTT